MLLHYSIVLLKLDDVKHQSEYFLNNGTGSLGRLILSVLGWLCGESLWLFGVIFKGVRVHVDIYKPTTYTQYVILLVIIRKQFFVILKSYTGPLLCVIILGFFCVVKVITSFKIYGVVWYHNSQHFLFF